MATINPTAGNPTPGAPTPGVAAAVPAATHDGSYIDWPAIIAGAVVASAISFVLFTFGSGIGLSMTSVEADEGVSLQWLTIAAGIWFVWVTISSFSAGGYLAGRMRRRFGDATEDESDTRDGAHGVIVWATGAVFGVLLAAAGLGGALGVTASATGAAAGGAAEMIAENGDYFADRILRGADISAETRDEVTTILARSVAEGEVAPDDRDYLVQLAANQTGTEPAQVEARVDAVLADMEAAREAAVQAADTARMVGVITAFVIAATMLVAAGAAYFAAVLGGQHRDESTPFRRFTTARRR